MVSSDWLCLPGEAGPTLLATSRALTSAPATHEQDFVCQTQMLSSQFPKLVSYPTFLLSHCLSYSPKSYPSTHLPELNTRRPPEVRPNVLLGGS